MQSTLTVGLPGEIAHQLVEQAKKRNISVNKLAREIIEQHIRSEESVLK